MPFRSEEAKVKGREEAVQTLTKHLKGPIQGKAVGTSPRERGIHKISELIDELGPVVEAYPMWHPLVSSCGTDRRFPETLPSRGYEGLDHTIYFRNGFVTCPYSGRDHVIEAVERLPDHPDALISAYTIEDVQLYEERAQPVVVQCKWDNHRPDGSIPKRLAVALMLEQQVPMWRDSEVAETWKTMRSYLLGRPCGARSSLFVNEDAGQALKDVYNAIINAGMYGPIYVE